MIPTLLALNLASILICHYIARARHAMPVFWGLMGALFGPLAIPFALCARQPR